MAGFRSRIGNTGLVMDVDVEGVDRTAQEFRQWRNRINRQLREAIRVAAEREALPYVKGFAPVSSGRLRSSLAVRKGAKNSAYVTSTLRGKKGRYVGLMEFGGIVEEHILPKGRGRKALKINNRFVTGVRTPRHYRARHFMTRGVAIAQPRLAEALKDEIMEMWRGEGVV